VADLTLDSAKTALVVIDLQRGVAAMPAAPRPAGEVVARAAQLAAAFRKAGATVVLVHVVRSPDGKATLRPLSDVPAPSRPDMPPEWAELMPELGLAPTDLVIAKRQWGAFYGTELDLQLRRRGVDTIVLCGISTNAAVESTARDAYEQVFVEDAMASRDAEDHRHTVTSIFPRIGRVRSTAEVLAAIK
jgi:nicotinamidase-related amidase